jgi:hypothetical protein
MGMKAYRMKVRYKSAYDDGDWREMEHNITAESIERAKDILFKYYIGCHGAETIFDYIGEVGTREDKCVKNK